MKQLIKERSTLAAILIVGLMLAVVGVFAFAGMSIRGQIELRADAAKRQCASSNEARKALTDVFVLLETAAKEGNPNQTLAEKRRSDEFFKDVYTRLAPRDCSQIAG